MAEQPNNQNSFGPPTKVNNNTKFRRVWPPSRSAHDDEHYHTRSDGENNAEYADMNDRENEVMEIGVNHAPPQSRRYPAANYPPPRHHPGARHRQRGGGGNQLVPLFRDNQQQQQQQSAYSHGTTTASATSQSRITRATDGIVRIDTNTILDGVDETLLPDKQQQQMNSKRSEAAAARDCPVCMMQRSEPIYGVLESTCNHWMCFVCAVRLRAICKDSRCPICRMEAQQIYLTNESPIAHPSSNHVNVAKSTMSVFFRKDASLGLTFATEQIYETVHQLLFRHKCSACNYTSAAFDYLEQHAKETHQLFYCHTCVQHLKLFTFERRMYGKQALNEHIRVGDGPSGGALQHGHPKCQLCSGRSFDRDEQLRHNRREHHICYCCEWGAKRKIVVFKDMLSLRKHMKKEHYVCEMGMCAEIDPPRAFNERQDLELHQVESHRRKDLSADLFFNLSFRRADLPSAPGVEAAASSSVAADSAASTAVVANNNAALAANRRARRAGTAAAGGADASSFAAQPEDFPSLTGGDLSRDPLESMLYANRLIDVSHDAQYPRLDANADATVLQKMLNSRNKNNRKNEKPKNTKPPPSLSSASERPQQRRDDFPALSSSTGNISSRIPPGLTLPTTTQQNNNIQQQQQQQSKSNKSHTSAASDSFAAKIQKPTGGAKESATSSIGGSNSVLGDSAAPATSAPAKPKERSKETVMVQSTDFPSLGRENTLYAVKVKPSNQQPRWVGAEKAATSAAVASKSAAAAASAHTNASALNVDAAAATSKPRGRSGEGMDAADRYNQFLERDFDADEEDESGAFPGLRESNKTERSDMGPWWRKNAAGGGGGAPSKKKGPKTVWKKS